MTQLELPPGISAKAFADPNFTGSFGDGRLIVCFDPASQTGGLYHVGQRLWRTWWPLDMATFAAIAQNVIEVELQRAVPSEPGN